MRGLSVVMMLAFGACANINYMAKVEESSYTATLASVPPWKGSPVRVVVGPTVHYWRSVLWDDIGHSYGISNTSEYSDGIPIEVSNETDKAVQIDWERTSFVDASGRSQHVIHSGAQLDEGLQTPTTIPGRARVSETIYPANPELMRGEWNRLIYLPTPVSGSSSAQVSLVLGVIVNGGLVMVPEPISVSIAGTASSRKYGAGWPTLLATCNPLIGCADNFTCSDTITDFRCVPVPPSQMVPPDSQAEH